MVQLVRRILSLQLTVVENKTFKVKRHLIKSATYLHMKKLQKETLCLQAFILKRSFILNIIASETGHFLEMVQLVHRILSLQLTVVENKTFKVKRHLIKSATYFTHEEVAKRNTLFTSIHFEEVIYSKQYCL